MEKQRASIDLLKSYGIQTSKSFKNLGERKMKKSLNLQLFADDAETTAVSGSGTAENTQTETTAAADQSGKPAETKGAPEEEKKYSDKDLDEILNKKFAKWKEQEQKKVDEAKKLASMNATEKVEYERDNALKELEELKKERDELKAQATLAEMKKTAQSILVEKDIKNVSDELLSMLVTTDAEATKKAIDSFATLYKQNIENAVSERLKGETPSVGAGRGAVHISEVERRIKKYEI